MDNIREKKIKVTLNRSKNCILESRKPSSNKHEIRKKRERNCTLRVRADRENEQPAGKSSRKDVGRSRGGVGRRSGEWSSIQSGRLGDSADGVREGKE